MDSISAQIFSDDVLMGHDGKPVPHLYQSREPFLTTSSGVAAQVVLTSIGSLNEYVKYMSQNKLNRAASGIEENELFAPYNRPLNNLPPYEASRLDVATGSPDQPVIKLKDIAQQYSQLPHLPSNDETKKILVDLVSAVQKKLHTAIKFHYDQNNHEAREYCHKYSDWWWICVYRTLHSLVDIMNRSDKSSDLAFAKTVAGEVLDQFRGPRGGHRSYFETDGSQPVKTPASRKRAFSEFDHPVMVTPETQTAPPATKERQSDDALRARLNKLIRNLHRSHSTPQFNIGNLNRAIIGKLPPTDPNRMKMERAVLTLHEKIYETLLDSAWSTLKKYIGEWQKSQIPTSSEKKQRT